MHANHAFCLDAAAAFAPRGRILDYGCGAGETLTAGLARGLDIYGVEVFGFSGGIDIPVVRAKAEAAGLLASGRLRELSDGVIPFSDGHFDFVFHNQVMEHVREPERVLQELRRVLAPGGVMLSLFPSKQVIRESHCGVPFAHRFGRNPLRHRYMMLCHRLGFGHFAEGKSSEEWARDFENFLDNGCFYRSFSELAAEYGHAGFTVEPHEIALIEFRLRQTRAAALSRIARICAPLCRTAFRRLADVVLLSRVLPT